MINILRGIIAGFAATVALSGVMLFKTMMGLMPQFDVNAMSSQVIGLGENPLVGWLSHVLIGTGIWGVLFALSKDLLPGKTWLQGAIFGILAWLLMMIFFMPMAGAGMFGINLGMPIPIMTLVLHLIFGIVLGVVYVRLSAESAATSTV